MIQFPYVLRKIRHGFRVRIIFLSRRPCEAVRADGRACATRWGSASVACALPVSSASREDSMLVVACSRVSCSARLRRLLHLLRAHRGLGSGVFALDVCSSYRRGPPTLHLCESVATGAACSAFSSSCTRVHCELSAASPALSSSYARVGCGWARPRPCSRLLHSSRRRDGRGFVRALVF